MKRQLEQKQLQEEQKEFDRLISNFNSCEIEENECLKLKPEINKTYGKYIFINKQ